MHQASVFAKFKGVYFAVIKLTFEQGPETKDDRKALRNLAEKIRARFKVCAAACGEDGDAGSTSIAVAALGSSEERLTHTLDAITEFCEASGFGRVESEQALLDHIDAVGDFAEGGDGD